MKEMVKQRKAGVKKGEVKPKRNEIRAEGDGSSHNYFGAVFLMNVLVLLIGMGIEKIAANSAASVGEEMLTMVRAVQTGFSPAFLVAVSLIVSFAAIMIYHAAMREKPGRFSVYWILALIAVFIQMYVFNVRMEEPMIILRSDSATLWELRKIFNNMILYYGGAYIVAIFAAYSAFIKNEKKEAFCRAGIVLLLFLVWSAVRIPLSLKVFSVGVSGMYHPLWMIAEGIVLGLAAGISGKRRTSVV